MTAASQLCLAAGAVLDSLWSGRRPLYPALLQPVALWLVAFMALRAGVLGARLGGIEWRGVRYDARLLRDAQRFRVLTAGCRLVSEGQALLASWPPASGPSLRSAPPRPAVWWWG